MRSITIRDIWDKLKIPSDNKYSATSFNDSNLWVLKNSKGNCGILISGTLENIKKLYVNIEVKYEKKLTTSNGVTIQNCLMILNNDSISSAAFCDTISSHISDREFKSHYKVTDIKDVLNRIERITKNKNESLNEVIGVWGELFILKEFIYKAEDENSILEIINAWESSEGRTYVDFNLVSSKLKIEVKTTINDARNHHIGSFAQLDCNVDWKGILASLRIHSDPGGISCRDLLLSIKDKISRNSWSYLLERIIVRGEKLCKDEIHRFTLSTDNEPFLFDFKDVPKPTAQAGVINIEWDVILDNIAPLTYKEKKEIFNMFN